MEAVIGKIFEANQAYVDLQERKRGDTGARKVNV